MDNDIAETSNELLYVPDISPTFPNYMDPLEKLTIEEKIALMYTDITEMKAKIHELEKDVDDLMDKTDDLE